MPAPFSALAVIDGSLFRLTRKGAPAGFLPPLATAIVEFHRGPLCIYVREHPFGLLPGIPNLYCIDAALRLRWIAEWPADIGPCIGIAGVCGNTLLAETASGARVTLDAFNGRLLRVEPAMAAAG